jgi:hypothetical protein
MNEDNSKLKAVEDLIPYGIAGVFSRTHAQDIYDRLLNGDCGNDTLSNMMLISDIEFLIKNPRLAAKLREIVSNLSREEAAAVFWFFSNFSKEDLTRVRLNRGG